ncbi:MAG TPA: HAMP domain-containing sensor histidine kinase [Acidimicrobiia bacterium]
MKRITESLLFRLVLSHLFVVVVAVVATALLSRSLAGSFFEAHLADMGADPAMGGMSVAMSEGLRKGFADSFQSALSIAVLVGAAAAILASTFSAIRVLRPLERVRRATRRLASGLYTEQIPIPVETELAALAHDVNALGEALEKVEERRVRLIAEVAHELRTPLTTIQGYMEGLLDGVFEPTEEVFAATAREATRLQRLAADLSSLSRAEEGAIELVTARVDLGSIAADAANRLRPQFEGSDVPIEVRRLNDLPVDGDPDRLAQVFTNIVGNALTYSSPGGKVEVVAQRRGTKAAVSVTDTGRGIAPEHLEAIFERFFRADRDAPGGTGIGLTIARRIARLHQGDVTATSPGLGHGSTFTVEIPLAG